MRKLFLSTNKTVFFCQQVKLFFVIFAVSRRNWVFPGRGGAYKPHQSCSWGWARRHWWHTIPKPPRKYFSRWRLQRNTLHSSRPWGCVPLPRGVRYADNKLELHTSCLLSCIYGLSKELHGFLKGVCRFDWGRYLWLDGRGVGDGGEQKSYQHIQARGLQKNSWKYEICTSFHAFGGQIVPEDWYLA